ncbi:hypothetical protein [Streptomyces sp. NBC_01716]|uniref:hypothetical protein n=1 Tax=Streptomyces sp. NBC_01716 TaxID=2975917 RepID=UPI002E3343EB|nr:hypothetical protein [Streptomyces sp. NBC_01716]
MPRPITLLGYEEEKSLERGHPSKALVFLDVEIVRPFERISQLIGRKEGSSLRPVTDSLTHRHHVRSALRSEALRSEHTDSVFRETHADIAAPLPSNGDLTP